MDFSWSAIKVHEIRTCTREKYIVSELTNRNLVHMNHVCFAAPPKKKHLRATAGRIHFDPIFPKTWEYPCVNVSCVQPIIHITTESISS